MVNRRLAAAAVSLLVLAAPPVPELPAQTSAPPGSAPRHLGFTFSSGSCELGPDFCAISSPRSWTASEVDLVRTSLDDIAGIPLGDKVIQRARTNGFQTFRRLGQAARLDAERAYQAEPTTVASAHTDDQRSIRSIDVTDRFFERRSIRDKFSGEPGYLLTTEILAHELFHAIDLDQQYTGTVEFR